jgi:hypothetical protein
VVAPVAVVEEEHAVVRDAGEAAEAREVGGGLVRRQRRLSTDLKVAIKAGGPSGGQHLPHAHARHHL